MGDVKQLARQYVVIRGENYDVTGFQQPGGAHMLDLAIFRSATVMFESMHVSLLRGGEGCEDDAHGTEGGGA